MVRQAHHERRSEDFEKALANTALPANRGERYSSRGCGNRFSNDSSPRVWHNSVNSG